MKSFFDLEGHDRPMVTLDGTLPAGCQPTELIRSGRVMVRGTGFGQGMLVSAQLFPAILTLSEVGRTTNSSLQENQ